VDVEIGHHKIVQQDAAIGMRVGSHAAVALGRQFFQFCNQSAILVEEFFGLVTLHPVFQKLYMIGMLRID